MLGYGPSTPFDRKRLVKIQGLVPILIGADQDVFQLYRSFVTEIHARIDKRGAGR